VHQEHIDNVVNIVSLASQTGSGARAPLRAFVLGIGSTVSTALCEGLARAGRGVALYAAQSSEIMAKCSRLVGAGIHPTITDVKIDWNATLTSPALLHSTEFVLRTPLRPLPPILQSPCELTTLYRNHRFVVHAILQTHHIPQEVIISGRIQNGVIDAFSIKVPVKRAKRFSTRSYSSAFLHVLAARNIICDFREGRLQPATTSPVPLELAKKAEIVRLGLRYQLVSEFTSLIGVDEGRSIEELERIWRRRRQRRHALRNVGQGVSASSPLKMLAKYVGPAPAWFNEAISRALGGRETLPDEEPGDSRSQSTSPTASDHSISSDWVDAGQNNPDRDGEDEDDGYSSGLTHSTMSSLESNSSIDVPWRRRHLARQRGEHPLRGSSPDVRGETIDKILPPRLQLRPEDLQLLGLQSYNGSFEPTEGLKQILGHDIESEANRLLVDVEVWTTVLALVHLEQRLVDQKELLEIVRDKVMEFVDRTVGRKEFERLRALVRID